MIIRTMGALGLIASVMAMSSLIYGAFQEPLYPYMQGITSSMLDVYRIMRNGIFGGLGGIFSGLINWIGQWLTWFPRAPWFSLSPIGADIVTLYALGFGTAFKAQMTYALKEHHRSDSFVYISSFRVALVWPLSSIRAILGFRNARERFEQMYDEFHEITGPHPDGESNREMIVSWNTENANRHSITYLTNYLSVFFGTVAFFLLVYAENRIGL